MTAKPSSVPLHRILLAEDDDSMRGFLVKALQKANYDVVAFENCHILCCGLIGKFNWFCFS